MRQDHAGLTDDQLEHVVGGASGRRVEQPISISTPVGTAGDTGPIDLGLYNQTLSLLHGAMGA